MKRATTYFNKKAKRRKIVKRLASMPDIEAELVLKRMRQKDEAIQCEDFAAIQKWKHKANVYYLLSMLFLNLECDDPKEVEDEVILFKTVYLLDEVLVKASLNVKLVEEYCVVCFIIIWKFVRVEESPDFEQVAYVLDAFRRGKRYPNDWNASQQRVKSIKTILRMREVAVLTITDFNININTPFDFIKTFMCSPGILYNDESEYEFKEKVNERLEELIKSSKQSLRKFKSETIAHLIIWLYREKSFGPFQDGNLKNVQKVYEQLKVT